RVEQLGKHALERLDRRGRVREAGADHLPAFVDLELVHLREPPVPDRPVRLFRAVDHDVREDDPRQTADVVFYGRGGGRDGGGRDDSYRDDRDRDGDRRGTCRFLAGRGGRGGGRRAQRAAGRAGLCG